MASWREFAASAPELAAGVLRLFDAHKHKTMATIRKDGSPRISGIEATFEDGQLWLGMMPSSRKAQDLRRDPNSRCTRGALPRGGRPMRRARGRHAELLSDLGTLDHVLAQGARKARELAGPMMERVRAAVGAGPAGR